MQRVLFPQQRERNRRNDSIPKHQNELFQIAKQTLKERQDITVSNCLKGVSGKVIVYEKEIKVSWEEYTEKLMNGIIGLVREGPADCITISEVAAALKKMKRQSLRFVEASSSKSCKSQGILELVDIGFVQCERMLHSRGLDLKCDTTNIQSERWPNGMWILQRN